MTTDSDKFYSLDCDKEGVALDCVALFFYLGMIRYIITQNYLQILKINVDSKALARYKRLSRAGKPPNLKQVGNVAKLKKGKCK
jgi:hypothetical protein